MSGFTPRHCSELFDNYGVKPWEHDEIYLDFFMGHWKKRAEWLGVDTDRGDFIIRVPTIIHKLEEKPEKPKAGRWSSCAMCRGRVTLKDLWWIKTTKLGKVLPAKSIVEDPGSHNVKWRMICGSCADKVSDELKTKREE